MYLNKILCILHFQNTGKYICNIHIFKMYARLWWVWTLQEGETGTRTLLCKRAYANFPQNCKMSLGYYKPRMCKSSRSTLIGLKTNFLFTFHCYCLPSFKPIIMFYESRRNYFEYFENTKLLHLKYFDTNYILIFLSPFENKLQNTRK